jgi:hypothetical protein
MEATGQWARVAQLAQEGKIPYIRVSSPPIEEKLEPRVRKRIRDPERPWAHFRSRNKSGRRGCGCLLTSCRNLLKKNDLLFCSDECRETYVRVVTQVLQILEEKPDHVYMDSLRGLV